MAIKDKRIDAYIAKAADFAKPILNHLRALVHKACPESEETMKWSFPHFDYKGEMMCSMAAFKEHCAFSFWKASLMKDPKLMNNAKSETAMGHLGKISSLKDLPADKTMIAYIKEAAKLNDDKIKVVKAKPVEKTPLVIPEDFKAALKKNKKAQTTFENFSSSNKKEYVQWITEAKSADTRNRRLTQAVAWMAEGKIKNWKYVK
jgi:uncharacterized protein YdeI (YjbR/CyaY-like superfamily)